MYWYSIYRCRLMQPHRCRDRLDSRGVFGLYASLYLYIYICIYTQICLYIYRERDRERDI